jgi:hypothetical protein
LESVASDLTVCASNYDKNLKVASNNTQRWVQLFFFIIFLTFSSHLIFYCTDNKILFFDNLI